MEKDRNGFVRAANLRPVADLALIDSLKLRTAQTTDLHSGTDDDGIEERGQSMIGQYWRRLRAKIRGRQVDLPIFQSLQAGLTSLVTQAELRAGTEGLVIRAHLLEQRSQVE